jgi:hypothetical protein
MAWTPAIPTAVQFISISQPLIQGNFLALDAWSQVDHSPIASAMPALNGFHYKTTFVPQNNPPFAAVPTFPVGYIGLYAANSPLAGNTNQLWLQNAVVGAPPFPVTASAHGGALNTGDSFYFTTGGQVVKYNRINFGGGQGQFTTVDAAAGLYNYNFTVAATKPVFSALVNRGPYVVATVQVAYANNTIISNVTVATVTNTGFTFYIRELQGNPATFVIPNPAVETISFIAIGIPA